ncbi:efflux RND transporter periplasmic adaptor subunit [Geomonas sp. RF6]|uniref:efflux RND transporter periplasmic adaptor subunit n=1 Tax=Geomonas sp. RF6 TaxID=2897342 RepID=UPI001E2F8725|nr:efflux RND transporter periplasmic adaptor subunit [Geomonas sp. RF6]UFS68911.1 efflux RND transporter periplasmic adaptor subunit [Geomonas sp. RF6]
MAEGDLNKLTIDKERFATRPSRGKKARLWAALAVAALLLVLAAWQGLFSPRVEVETAAVSMVYPSQTFSLLNASGYVVAQRKAAVSSKATGRLDWLGVEEGSVVRAGQPLARLDARDVKATEEQSAANVVNSRHTLEQARVEQKDAARALKRAKELVSQGIIAQADYDTAEARYQRGVAATAAAEAAVKSTQAALRNAQATVDYTVIRAPFDGVVLTKDADVGDIVTPLGAAANAKAAVVTLADMGSLEVEADVSEANISRVRPGQPCEVLLDALPDVRFPAVLHTIVPTADRSKGSVMVKVRFLTNDRRILPEMSAKVAFLEREIRAGEDKPRVAVLPTAVATREGRSVVYVVRGDSVAETPVKLGTRMGEWVEIVSGVKAGEKIAIKPLDKLHDGTKVKVPEK